MSQAQQIDILDKPPTLCVDAVGVGRLQNAGGAYHSDFITEAEEAALLQAIDAAPWQNDLRRRVQHYGYRYDYKARGISQADRIAPLPDWVRGVCDKMQAKGIFAPAPTPVPDQMIVNEYTPKQGIAAHTDRDCFGAVVASLSLASDCMMRLTEHRRDSGFELVLKRRSLLVLAGLSRTDWRHEIAPRAADKQNGVSIARGRRVSLTFRTVILDGN